MQTYIYSCLNNPAGIDLMTKITEDLDKYYRVFFKTEIY